MRVLHAIWSLSPSEGGPPIALTTLAAAQREAGMDVSIVATTIAGESLSLAEKLRSANVNVELIGPCRGRLRRHPALASTLDRHIADADIVHLHGVWDEIQHLAARSAHRRAVPYIITPHGMLDDWCLSQRWLKKRLYLAWRLQRDLREAAAIHFTTDAERAATCVVSANHQTIIEPLGLDGREFETLPPRGTFRTRHKIEATRPMLLFLGRVVPVKGVDLLLLSLARMKRTDALLVIAGPVGDDLRASLRELIERHALQERMLFAGMLHGCQRVEALVDADLLALTSHRESFAMSVAESLAAGTPVLVSDRVALADIVRGQNVGGVVPLDPGAIAGELDRWLCDVELRVAASTRARSFARDYFDASRLATRWMAHYARLTT